MKLNYSAIYFVLLLWSFYSSCLHALELEPRRWSHLPIDSQILGVAVVHTNSYIFFDPVLRITDGEYEAETIVTSYLQSFDLLGKTALLDVRLPYKSVRWSGLLDGSFRRVRREGLSDPLLRLSVNFIGAPALKAKDFFDYRSSHTSNTIIGAALAVRVPIGQYKKNKLFNLGKNRFMIMPQIGVLHTNGPWNYELTGSISFFTNNNEFFGENKLEQDPMFFLQSHLIYHFKNSIWSTLSLGYDRGGETTINKVKKDDKKENFFFAFSAGIPVNKISRIKLTYINGRTQNDLGSDSNTFVLSYSYSF